MGNRAVITTKDRKIGLYLHWNGGRDTVEPLLRYCELKGYRAPSQDDYGWARICQVLGNFFGGTHCVGIGAYTDDKRMNPGDNGIYVIDGWEITGRIYPYEHFEEQREYPFDEMLRAFDGSMPEGERLGGFLDAVEVPIGEVRVGDTAWVRGIEAEWKPFPVVGFGDEGSHLPGRPYVAMLDHGGDFSWNPNNYLRGETVYIDPRH